MACSTLEANKVTLFQHLRRAAMGLVLDELAGKAFSQRPYGAAGVPFLDYARLGACAP
jgi:hypothetical protein